jgi:adenosylmethionine-8-amino-7-oxononanoate aminotransferase
VPPYPFRDRGQGTDEELIQRRAGELREAIVGERPDTVSAVIMEPVISSGGFVMPPIGWLRAVRAICDELDVLMIADEVITGFGRTGRWFACEHDGVVPDLMTVAKGITSGYVPLSAAIARRRLADVFPDTATEENVHPGTYAAHPVACAAALANIRILEQDDLVVNAAAMGARLLDGLQQGVGKKPIVGEVRGRGLMVCVEFVEPDGSGRPLDREQVAKLDRKAWDRGAIVYARGPSASTCAQLDPFDSTRVALRYAFRPSTSARSSGVHPSIGLNWQRDSELRRKLRYVLPDHLVDYDSLTERTLSRCKCTISGNANLRDTVCLA